MILTRAPLRIPLGGGGTDFPGYYQKHGGYLLGFALNKYVHVALNDTIDQKIRLKYSKTEVVDDVDELENRVAAEAFKFYGVTSGVEVATFADVPESSGLGGSSSFCVALIAALRHKLGLSQDKYEIFQDAYNIERIKAEQPGGVQDQLFASLGGAWSTTLGDNSKLDLGMVDINRLLPKLKLVYTNIHRTSLAIASKQIKDTFEENEDILKSLALTKKLGREIEDCLKNGTLDKIGDIFHTHWTNKKTRSDEISSTDLDVLYSKAMRSGATGGKLLGLGGGGYFLFYIPEFLQGFETLDIGVDWEGARVVYSS